MLIETNLKNVKQKQFINMAVVRIKRRCNEEPLDILLLTCKKRKTDVEESQKTSLFKIAATVNEQDDKALHFAHQFKKDAEQKIKKGNDKFKKVVDKLRKEHKVNSENSRLKVVNCYRALNEAELLSADDGKEKIDPDPGGLTVLDVETCQESQEKTTEASASVAEGTYVYDIYYTADGSDLSDVQIDHELSVYPMDSDLSSYLCADIDISDSEAPDDEDDSNDENNWRNDYPDEEDFSSDEDGREIANMKLCSNFNSLKIDGSDDEEDEYLDYQDDYDDSPQELSSEENLYSGNLSPSDVCNFGESYAKYKAKVKSEYYSSCSVEDDHQSQD